MPSLKLVAKTGLRTDVTIDVFFKPTSGPDTDISLARAVLVALNTERLALPDDTLPDPRSTNRRGWWGDLNAATIWGGWPIGWRGWLLRRAKITDANAALGSILVVAEQYLAEALQPFVTAKICTSFATALSVLTGPSGDYGIAGTITIFRGQKSSISLEYQDVWAPYGG